MIFDPYLEWLGFRTRRPVAGLHITSSHLVLVALRRRPLRLVAVGRRAVTEAAVVDGDIRLVAPLVATLRLLIAETRIAPGTPTAVVVDPLAGSTLIDIGVSAPAACDVSSRTHDRIHEVVAGAGLTVRTVDVLPAALARLGGLLGAPAVALDADEGWTTSVVDGRLDSRRIVGGPTQPALRMGRDLGSTVTVVELPGIGVPDPLQPAFDPGRDGVAVGGVLSLLGYGPRIPARPAAVPVGSGWTVQSVAPATPTWSDREPIGTVPTQ